MTSIAGLATMRWILTDFPFPTSCRSLAMEIFEASQVAEVEVAQTNHKSRHAYVGTPIGSGSSPSGGKIVMYSEFRNSKVLAELFSYG